MRNLQNDDSHHLITWNAKDSSPHPVIFKLHAQLLWCSTPLSGCFFSRNYVQEHVQGEEGHPPPAQHIFGSNENQIHQDKCIEMIIIIQQIQVNK